jgi:hypothetical protein
VGCSLVQLSKFFAEPLTHPDAASFNFAREMFYTYVNPPQIDKLEQDLAMERIWPTNTRLDV